MAANNFNTLLNRLKTAYPNARYELDWETPLQLLIATILAAQCPDIRVNQVTKTLFAKYTDAAAYANISLSELEEDVRPTGFYKNKAKAIQGMCQMLVEKFAGQVPTQMSELIKLPGVARKTANVLLNNAFKIASGIIVDTHVNRVSQRLGLTTQTNSERIEEDLMKLIPQDEWIFFGAGMVLHGRYVCTAAKPQCDTCIINDICPKIGVTVGETTKKPARTKART